MERLLNGKLFSWLKGDIGEEVTELEVELMAREFVTGLIRWSEETRDYREVARGFEGIYIRLQVWNEMNQIGDRSGKK